MFRGEQKGKVTREKFKSEVNQGFINQSQTMTCLTRGLSPEVSVYKMKPFTLVTNDTPWSEMRLMVRIESREYLTACALSASSEKA